MARRNGERLASAKAFITEQIRTGQEITVQQVQQEFADVATCRSIYRWIAQARATVDNPGQVNQRNLARAYITAMIDQGRRCRVVDVLNHFPGVASTTTIYRWLNEARRPDLAHSDSEEKPKMREFEKGETCKLDWDLIAVDEGGIEGYREGQVVNGELDQYDMIIGEQPCQDQDTALALLDLYTSAYRKMDTYHTHC